jgi:rhodanese-related sulfurtransferase
MGYTDVRVLEGGLDAWRASGRRVVQGVNVPSKVFGERALHDWKTPQIAPRELHARMAAGADMVIVDSRTPEEYTRGCVPGAVNVPGGELVFRIADLIQRPTTPIVVHCGGRTRSYIGAESLRRMHLPNPIVALENGTMGWELAGLELERGAERRAPDPSPHSRAAASLVAQRVATEDGVAFVSPHELRALIGRRDRDNLYVFDVRTSEEYAANHIEGAIWLPGGQAVQATDDFVAVRQAFIVLACDGITRSVMTAAWLKRMGYPRVAVLAGGLPEWIESGGETESTHPVVVPFGYDAARARVKTIAPRELQRAINDDPSLVILNVDQSDRYARGHVPRAAWVCRSRLEFRIGSMVRDKHQPVVLTCTDDFASTLAAATLADLEYTRASVLDGGTRSWEAAGMYVERGPTRLADEADDVTMKPYEKGREAMETYLKWEEALDGEGGSPVPLIREARPS